MEIASIMVQFRIFKIFKLNLTCGNFMNASKRFSCNNMGVIFFIAFFHYIVVVYFSVKPTVLILLNWLIVCSQADVISYQPYS